MMFRKQSFGIPLLLALAACGNSKSANDPATAGSSGSSATSGATTSSATTSGATTGDTTTGDTTSTTSATTSATTTEMSTTAGGSTGAGGSATLPPPGPPGCGLKQAAFCDTFDTPSPGGRGGDLDDAKWSVARISGENNQGQGAFNVWGATTTQACGKKTDGVSVPNDMFFCAGGGTASMHFNDSYNDGGDFTIHSYRIRQPFDFSGRTGTVAFDVDARGSIPGGHGFWFNIFISDEPIPAPYQNGAFTALFARAGVGIEFESVCSDNLSANTVSNVFIEKGYKITKEYPAPPTPYKTPCLKTKEEVLNHIEIRISQTKIEIWGSDAGEPNTFRSLMVVDNVQVPLTRGYVHLQHTHYNATKCTFTDPKCTDCDNHSCPTFPGYATYHWDNVGFDGPVFPNPRSYEGADNNVPNPRPDTAPKFPEPYFMTGYQLGTDGWKAKQRGFIALNDGRDAVPLQFPGVDLTDAKSAAITYNAWAYCKDPIMYRFNGGTWRTFKTPFPECDGSARAVFMPVDLADLKQGDNSFEMYSNTGTGSVVGPIVAHVELTVETN
jgi:hypothetical protein